MKISGNRRHRFVCSDTAEGKLLFIDESGNITQEMPGIIGAFDIWVLPDGNILCAHNSGIDSAGITILNRDGVVQKRHLTGKEIFSCQPLEDGNILLGLLGEPQLVEIDPQGRTVTEINVPYEGAPHEGMRLARKKNDAYYVVQPGINTIRKLSLNGKIMKEFTIRPDAFGLVVLPNDHIVYSCMSGAYELNGNGEEIWSLTDADVPEIHIRWLLGIQLLSNGNLVFTNWMGHGHLDEGVHFFEVNKDKEVVWSLDGRGTLQMPATAQILDEEQAKVCFAPMK